MPIEHLDISGLFTWEEDLPRLPWDLVDQCVESQIEPEHWEKAWIGIGQQWLERLAAVLGRDYRVEESENFLLLVPVRALSTIPLMRFAEKCRQILLAALQGVADFTFAGKQAVLIFENQEAYYRYISPFYEEGDHIGSRGMFIRSGHPHTVQWGTNLTDIESTLAHELTHASLAHLTLPLWIEEGLTQMFQHDITGLSHLLVDEEIAAQHKRYWGRHGLDEFWRGEGFSRREKTSKLSYQLAEILIRLLIEEYRPRWFGWDKEPLRKFFAFLREADSADCGQAAASAHLGVRLSEIASKFLGPGSWEPDL